MAATTASLQAVGLQTGQSYNVDCAVPDAVATQWTFDDGAGATTTSPAWYSFPEDVMLIDISMAAAPTATRGRITSNGVPSGNVIRYVSHLYSLNNRPRIGVKVKAGNRVGIVQL